MNKASWVDKTIENFNKAAEDNSMKLKFALIGMVKKSITQGIQDGISSIKDKLNQNETLIETEQLLKYYNELSIEDKIDHIDLFLSQKNRIDNEKMRQSLEEYFAEEKTQFEGLLAAQQKEIANQNTQIQAEINNKCEELFTKTAKNLETFKHVSDVDNIDKGFKPLIENIKTKMENLNITEQEKNKIIQEAFLQFTPEDFEQAKSRVLTMALRYPKEKMSKNDISQFVHDRLKKSAEVLFFNIEQTINLYAEEIIKNKQEEIQKTADATMQLAELKEAEKNKEQKQPIQTEGLIKTFENSQLLDVITGKMEPILTDAEYIKNTIQEIKTELQSISADIKETKKMLLALSRIQQVQQNRRNMNDARINRKEKKLICK